MRFFRLAALPLALILLAGCATRPKIDWQSRVGNYTYDQAVLELGVPDKTAKLGDGVIVAEWLVRADSPTYWGVGGSLYVGSPYWSEPEIVRAYPASPYSGRWLRLVFAPDGKLRSFEHYER